MEAERSTTARLFRLFATYARMDLLWMASDAKSCLLWIVTDLVVNLAAISGIYLLAARFSHIGVWTYRDLLFLLGYGATVSGIMDVLFGMNVSMISRRVGRGQLDHQMVQPVPLWMSLLTEGFAPFSASGTLIVGFTLMVGSAAGLSVQKSPLWYAALAANLIASVSIAMAFQFAWGSLAFWAPRGAEEVNSSTYQLLMQLKQFPLDGAGAILASGLLTVLPVGFVAWYPCRYLTGLNHRIAAACVAPCAAAVAVLIAFLVFRAGLNHYAQTGSQRYSGFGFRS